MAPMETAPGYSSDGAAQFAEDATGTRVMRNGNSDNPYDAFIRVRRWRKLAFGLSFLLVIVVTIAFAAGRESVLATEAQQDGLDGEASKHKIWKQVGETLVQEESESSMAGHEFINFGCKVRMNMEGSRIMVAKQGLNRVGGGISIYSH